MSAVLSDAHVPVGQWLADVVTWFLGHFRWLIDAINSVVGSMYNGMSFGFEKPGVLVVAGVLVVLAFYAAGWKTALFTFLSLALIYDLDLWTETAQTLSLMTTAITVSLAIGIPAGILAAESKHVRVAVEPTLDFMQTIHPFVYLVPVVFAFGIGPVPAVLATVLYVTPVSARLTIHGVLEVPDQMIAAGEAFGCSRMQLLTKVKLPLAFRAILVGVNQTIVLSLGFIVIAALIGAAGLGQGIVNGITQLDLAEGFNAGVAVALVAIILDRIVRGLGQRSVRAPS